jgi:hypothetical protein
MQDFEALLAIKLMREIVYYQVQLYDKIPASVIKMGGAERVVKMWIRLLSNY